MSLQVRLRHALGERLMDLAERCAERLREFFQDRRAEGKK